MTKHKLVSSREKLVHKIVSTLCVVAQVLYLRHPLWCTVTRQKLPQSLFTVSKVGRAAQSQLVCEWGGVGGGEAEAICPNRPATGQIKQQKSRSLAPHVPLWIKYQATHTRTRSSCLSDKGNIREWSSSGKTYFHSTCQIIHLYARVVRSHWKLGRPRYQRIEQREKVCLLLCFCSSLSRAPSLSRLLWESRLWDKNTQAR